jgi:iron(III) transport system ATP-binding protein
MLRPEQLRLVTVPENEAVKTLENTVRYGKVVDIEFGGAVCTLMVAILDNQSVFNGGTPAPVQIKCSAVNLPSIDDHVRIEVLGEPHIFA